MAVSVGVEKQDNKAGLCHPNLFYLVLLSEMSDPAV